MVDFADLCSHGARLPYAFLFTYPVISTAEAYTGRCAKDIDR